MKSQVTAIGAMVLMVLGAAGCKTATSAAGPAQPPSHSAASALAATASASAGGSPRPSPHATASAPAATPPAPAKTRTLASSTYAVTITVPKSWTPTPYAGRFAYSGATGWVELNAVSGNLTTACQDTATANVLHVYGRHPKITYREIDGRPGCVILPSAGAPREPVRAGGPAFFSSAALVRYPHPVRIGGTTWPTLLIFADPVNLMAIVNSVQLHH